MVMCPLGILALRQQCCPLLKSLFLGGNLIFKRVRFGTLALHGPSGYRKSVPSLSTIEHTAASLVRKRALVAGAWTSGSLG